MSRSVSQKMGLKEGTRTFLANAPENALRAIQAPALDVSATLEGQFGYIHLFATTQSEMDVQFPEVKAHLSAGGMLWVSWPKGRKLGTDLTLPQVIRIGYNHGLVESTTLSFDETWSAMKFTHPKPGKIYNNSFGKLPPRDRRDT